MVFFSFSVFASTYADYTVGGSHNTYTANGCTIYVEVESLNPVGYGGEMRHIITVSIRNLNTDRSVYLSGNVPILVGFSPNAQTSNTSIYEIRQVNNFGPNFSIVPNQETAYLRLVPNAEYSYLSFICIPPETTLSSVAVIQTNSVSVASGGSSVNYYAVCDTVSFKTNEINVTYTDYMPFGSSDDALLNAVLDMSTYLSTVIHADLMTIDTDLDLTNAWLQNIKDITTDIYNRLGTKLDQLHADNGVIHNDITTSNSWLSQIKAFVENINSTLGGVTNTNSGITDGSSTVKNTSDSIHTQEQIYFAQNAQAIQATGLGNYQIGTVEGNGIGAVSNDFTAIWNALGGWTSVYIFSLTLSLALTIIRHAPSAVTRAQSAARSRQFTENIKKMYGKGG